MAPVPTDYTQMTRRQIVFSFSIVTSLFFLWGFSYGLLDVLNAHFLEIFHLTRTETTLLQFAYFVSYLLVAPPMGIFMRRYGYKIGIHVGLGLFSIGAVLFWPAAVYRQYGMFIAFTFIIASGLATLEVAANSYMTLLGPPQYAAFRLTLAQAFNGIATVIGPLIASKTFFNESDDSGSLGSVQYVYLAMSCFGVLLNVLLIFARLPEVRQVIALDAKETTSIRGFLKQKHTIYGFVAEFAYTGAQVAVASHVIFYLTHQPGVNTISDATASNMFSGCQAVFTVGRFIGVVYLRYIDPCFSLFVNGVGLIVFSVLTSVIPGKGGIACLFLIFFFESTCYPTIFSVATSDLGIYAKLGSGLISAGVSGGAVWPAMQSAVSDRYSAHISFLIPMIGFIPLTIYGLIMWISRSKRYNDGRITIKVYQPPLEIDSVGEEADVTHKEGFDTKAETEFAEQQSRYDGR